MPLMPLILAGILAQGCITVAACIVTERFMGFLFPTLKKKTWVGKFIGLYAVTLALNYTILLIAHYRLYGELFLYLIIVLMLGTVSIVFLDSQKKHVIMAKSVKPNYWAWVFGASGMWIVIHIINFAIFFEGI